MKESPFIAVLKRELDRMVSRRIYFASCIVLPLFFCKLSCCWSLHTPLAVKGNSILQPIGWQWQMGISGWRSLPSYFHTVLSSSL